MEKPANVDVRFSMQNMFDTSIPWAVYSPVEMYSHVATTSGYKNLEYFPWKLIPDIQVRKNLLTDKGLSCIGSAHQSWRSEKNLKESLQHPNPKLAVFAYFTAPERMASTKNLSILQQKLGNIPLVLHPSHNLDTQGNIFEYTNLKNKLVQPAPELLDRWETTPERLTQEAAKRGYDGFCLDLFHIRRHVTQGKISTFKSWQETIPILLPFTKEIHIGLGRNDFQGYFNSMQELGDLIYGTQTTDIIPILEMVRNSGWSGPLVTEIPAASVKAIEYPESRFLYPSQLIKTHKRIVSNLKSIFKTN